MVMWAVLITALSACGNGGNGGDGANTARTVKVGMAHDVSTGRGDKSFNDAASTALDKVHEDFEVETKDLFATKGETQDRMENRLEQLTRDGYNPVIAVGFGYADALAKVAKKYPATRFAIVDSSDVTGPNIANLVFAEEQGSFLVGAAAALKSENKNVGFIGGVHAPLLDKFEAGFKAGVAAVDKTIKVLVTYLAQPPDFSGFSVPAKARTTAEGMYDAGTDVIFAAAGGSGMGVFQAAKAKGKLAIGVEYSQHNGEPADLQSVIMTSMVKRIDIAVYDFAKRFLRGDFKVGKQLFDLGNGGVGYYTSGGRVDDIAGMLDDFSRQIVEGKITVPTTPEQK